MLWRRRNNPGSSAFALTLLSLSVWSFASIFEAGALTAENKIFWSKWQYFGITTISPLWFIFSAQFTGREKILTRPVRYLIWVIPVITLALANTNELHGLIWKGVEVVDEGFYLGIYDHNIGFISILGTAMSCFSSGRSGW